MVVFEDIDDLEEWLAPFDYLSFWNAVAPYNLVLQDRDHCDALISSGTVDAALVLEGLKYMAVLEISKAFGLRYRAYHPPIMALH